MADSTRDSIIAVPAVRPDGRQSFSPLRILLLIIAAGVVLVFMALAAIYQSSFIDTATGAVTDSTFGQLGLWMAEQSALETPPALLGQVAKNWAASLGQPSLDPLTALNAVRTVLVFLSLLVSALLLAGLVGLVRHARWTRRAYLAALIILDLLLFVVPPLEGDPVQPALLLVILLVLALLLVTSQRATKFMGFMVVFSALLVVWETGKTFAASVQYQIALPQTGWTYQIYPTLEDALAAVESGESRLAVVDENDVEDLIPAAPLAEGVDPSSFAYPDLRILSDLETAVSTVGFRIEPVFPGRLAVVARPQDETTWTSVSQLLGLPVATHEGAFSNERFLNLPRVLVLLDLKVFNDLNLPHLQSIIESLLQPARRNGEFLLVRILGAAALFTWSEAAVGFVSGAFLGFLLGALFAHSRLLERGLLPYVIASQTVPMLAIAPLVVLWLGAGAGAVAVIAAYLTFFPVTINTLRGLTSPDPTALELMHSYAASQWTTMWKLRFPAALPYIFTALKVSATASVVGAIIGELPSGIRDGLGGAILNFNQYYTSDPAKLWAAILVAALVGMVFFVIIGILERFILGSRIAEN